MLPLRAASRAIVVGPCSRTSCSAVWPRRWFASRHGEGQDFQTFLSKGLSVSNNLPKGATATAAAAAAEGGGFVSKLPKYLCDHMTLEMDAEITRLMTLTEEQMKRRRSSSSSSSVTSPITIATLTPVPLHPLAQQILCYLQTYCHDWILERQLEQLNIRHNDGTFQLDFPDGQSRIWTTLTRPQFLKDDNNNNNDNVNNDDDDISRRDYTTTTTTTTTTSTTTDNNQQNNLFLCLASEKTSVRHTFLLQADRVNEKQLQETVHILMQTVEEEGW